MLCMNLFHFNSLHKIKTTLGTTQPNRGNGICIRPVPSRYGQHGSVHAVRWRIRLTEFLKTLLKKSESVLTPILGAIMHLSEPPVREKKE